MPKSQSLNITPLKHTDIPALIAMDRQVFAGSETEAKCLWSEKQWRKVIKNSEFTFGLRLIDNVSKTSTLIGSWVVSLEASKDNPNLKHFVIQTVVVAPEHQRQGHATRMLVAFKNAFLQKYTLTADIPAFRFTISQDKPNFKFFLANSASYKMSTKTPGRYIFIMDAAKLIGFIAQAERKLAEKEAAATKLAAVSTSATTKKEPDLNTPLLPVLPEADPQQERRKLRCVIS